MLAALILSISSLFYLAIPDSICTVQSAPSFELQACTTVVPPGILKKGCQFKHHNVKNPSKYWGFLLVGWSYWRKGRS